MESKKVVGFGGRGWLLMIYQALAYVTFQVFTQYPLNILADLYGGAQLISKIYSTAAIVGIVVQLDVAVAVADIVESFLLAGVPAIGHFRLCRLTGEDPHRPLHSVRLVLLYLESKLHFLCQ